MEEILKKMEQNSKNNKRNIDIMMKALDMMILVTGDKTAILLKKSVQISDKDKKIIDKFLRNNYTKEEQELTIRFYEQINNLYSDFIKELNIN